MTPIPAEAIQAVHDDAVRRGWAGQLAEAEYLLREVLRATPHDALAQKHLAIVLLCRGNLREGAPLYESRLGLPRAEPTPNLPHPRWSGEPLEGKRVLIWPEQGFGDQIQFARFAAVLQQRGCDVTLLCNLRLERLFQQSLGVRVIGTSGTIEFPDPDLWIWSNSLVSALVRDEGDIPSAPYLRATPRRSTFRIGVAAVGNPTHGNDQHRSLPQELASELLSLPGCGSLLPGDTGARDFADTAEIIAGLDLVISVDTSIAHLAGAMGKACWILLPAGGTDWRWMRNRDDSPWYPSATLLRQPTPSDWRSVIDQVRERLQMRG